jgi:hypothetical protein
LPLDGEHYLIDDGKLGLSYVTRHIPDRITKEVRKEPQVGFTREVIMPVLKHRPNPYSLSEVRARKGEVQTYWRTLTSLNRHAFVGDQYLVSYQDTLRNPDGSPHALRVAVSALDSNRTSPLTAQPSTLPGYLFEELIRNRVS